MTKLTKRYLAHERAKRKERRKKIYKKIIEYRTQVKEAKKIAKKKRKPLIQKKLPTDYEVLRRELERLERSLDKKEKLLKKLKRGTRKYNILKRKYDIQLRENNIVREELRRYREYIHKTYVVTFNYSAVNRPKRRIEIHITLDIPIDLVGADQKRLFKELYRDMKSWEIEQFESWIKPVEGWTTHSIYHKKSGIIGYDFRYSDLDHKGNTRKDSGTVRTIAELKRRARRLI